MPRAELADPWSPRSLLSTIRTRSGWMEVLGLALLGLGIFALIMVDIASLATVYLLGALLLAEGVAYIAATVAFWRVRSGGFLLGILLGSLCIIAGFLCLIRPAQSLGALTLVLGVYFIASGIARMAVLIRHRLPGWGWGTVAAVIDLFLGILILGWWPVSSLIVPGTLLAVQLIYSGIAALTTGMAVRRVLSPPAGAEPEAPSGGRPATRFQH